MMEATKSVPPECSGNVESLRAFLNTLLEKTQEGGKPWLRWPSTWEEIKESEQLKFLRNFLTSPDVHRERLEEVRQQFLSAAQEKGLASEGSVVFLEGGTSDEWMLYSSDCNKSTFRQEAFFQHLIGVNEPDLLAAFFVASKKLILFIPRVPPDALRFLGPPRDSAFYRNRYAVTDAIEVDGLKEVEEELKRRGVHTLHVLQGVNSDSGRPVNPPKALASFSSFKVDYSSLYDILVDCRLHKTPREAEFLAAACLCSSQAHCFVARRMRPKMVEGQGETLFKAYVGFVGGARHVAYDCICCAGLNASILHYGHAGRPNDAAIADGDLLLYDMGGDFGGYATDITLTFPANGVFTDTQREIYSAVLDAQKSVIKCMRPGVKWTDMHRLAERVLLKHLKELGLVVGSIEECEAASMGALFMPHGLGHFIGLDTHDVGGFTPSFPPSDLPGLRYLRTTRVLQKGMCITVEPGMDTLEHLCAEIKRVKGGRNYFEGQGKAPLVFTLIHPERIDKKLLGRCAGVGQAKSLYGFYLNDKYKNVGGVRLEDDVLITQDGVQNLTVVPRTVEDVEELLQLGMQ